ncbi:hypothetical protein [Methylobacterium sp. Gmos1]
MLSPSPHHPSHPTYFHPLNRLERLFNRQPRGLYPRDSIWTVPALHKPFMTGRMKLRLERIPADIVGEVLARGMRGGSRESEEHVVLKRVGREWMRRCGALDAAEEKEAPSGRADVYSAEHAWIIEVGMTAFGRVLSAWEQAGLNEEPAHRFTLLPFQALTWADETPRAVLAVDVSCDAALPGELWATRWDGMKRASETMWDRMSAPSSEQRLALDGGVV